MVKPRTSVRIACSVRVCGLSAFKATEYGGAMHWATCAPLARKLKLATASPGGSVTVAVATKLAGAAKEELLVGVVRVQFSPGSTGVTAMVVLLVTPSLSVAVTVRVIGDGVAYTVHCQGGAVRVPARDPFVKSCTVAMPVAVMLVTAAVTTKLVSPTTVAPLVGVKIETAGPGS